MGVGIHEIQWVYGRTGGSGQRLRNGFGHGRPWEEQARGCLWWGSFRAEFDTVTKEEAFSKRFDRKVGLGKGLRRIAPRRRLGRLAAWLASLPGVGESGWRKQRQCW